MPVVKEKQQVNQLLHNLSRLAKAYPSAMEANAMHGFLTGVSITSKLFYCQPWMQKVLGLAENLDLSLIPDDVQKTMDQVVEQIDLELSGHRFNPVVSTEHIAGVSLPATHKWAQGFIEAVKMVESDWEMLTDNNSFLGKQLLGMNVVADPETYAPLFFNSEYDLSSTKNLIELRQMAGMFASSMYLIIVSEESRPTEEEVVKVLKDCGADIEDSSVQALSTEDLLEYLCSSCDCVPANVIEECVVRQEQIQSRLIAYLDDDKNWQSEDDLIWWSLVHCVFVLGRLSDQNSAEALLRVLQRRQEEDYNEIWDWFAGYWPALFNGKMAFVYPQLLQMVKDDSGYIYARYDALECVLYYNYNLGEAALDEAIDVIVSVTQGIDELNMERYLFGGLLLSFPRTRHAEFMRQLAREQDQDPELICDFSVDDVDLALVQGDDAPWHNFSNPWKFYEPREIAQRQLRWMEEEQSMDDEMQQYGDYSSGLEISQPVIRDMPKISRNDPCPCGSGKKFKKCCLH